MSINLADVMKQMYDTAQEVRNGRLEASDAQAIAALGSRQIEIARVALDYMKLLNDPQVTIKNGDVFVGTPTPQISKDK